MLGAKIDNTRLSASSSVTSRLLAVRGLRGVLLLELDEAEEKFFCDLVREPLSRVPSSFTVALIMLLIERQERTTNNMSLTL